MIRCAALALTVLLCSCSTMPKSKFDSMSDRSRRWVATADSYAIDVIPGARLGKGSGTDGVVMGGGIMFGLVGIVIASSIVRSNATSRGAVLTRQDGLADPAPLVADGLRARMANRHRAVSDDANLHLRIKTSNWGMDKNEVTYSATMQVVSAATGAVVMKGECRYANHFRSEGTSLEGLLGHSGAGLKQQYVRAADYCSDYFAGKLLPATT